MLSIPTTSYFHYFLSPCKNVDFHNFYKFSKVWKFASTFAQARKFSQLPKKYFSQKKSHALWPQLNPHALDMQLSLLDMGEKSFLASWEGLQKKRNLDVPYCTPGNSRLIFPYCKIVISTGFTNCNKSENSPNIASISVIFTGQKNWFQGKSHVLPLY